MQSLSPGGFDIAWEAAGAPQALTLAIERVRKGGEFKVSTYERFMKYFAGTGRFVPRISPNDRRTRAWRQAQGRDAAV